MKTRFNRDYTVLVNEKMLRNGILLILVVCLFSACQDVVELEVPKGDTRLVIDGRVYHGKALQEVTISTTSPFFDKGNTPRVSNATVVIEDNLGHRDTLTEGEKGVYQIKKEGDLGKRYRLEIVLENGKRYGSSYQELKPVPAIDSIYYEMTGSADNAEFSVSFNFKDNQDVKDFYRWNYAINGKYNNASIISTSDKFFNGSDVKDVDIINDEDIASGDQVLIEQMSINEEEYIFIQKFKQSLETGGLFSSPPIPVRGNVVNLDDSKEYALGFFGVSSVTKAEIKIK